MRSNKALSGKTGATRTSEIRIVKRLFPLLLLPALLLCATSCKPLLREVFENPKVRLASVGFSGNPFQARGPMEAILYFSVTNPNSYALNVTQVAYTVTIGKQRLASGERNEEIRIEPSGDTIVKIPVLLDTDTFSAAVREVLEARTVPYEFNGSLGVSAPLVGVVRVPFSRNGTIDPMDLLRKKGIGFN
jgi:LEA14-like dessication related protein